MLTINFNPYRYCVGVVNFVTLSGVFKIAAGKYHALAMTSDGAVLAWGLNDNGQLGNNSTTNQNVPVKVLCPPRLTE